jgi:hypothetical protein
MSKGAIYLISGTLVLLALISSEGFSQDHDRSSVRLMFYNVENFFDTYDDTLKEDNDFLPGGLMRWNYKRYTNKINSVYKVIAAAGEWDPPAIAGFCEIEKKSVLQDITTKTYLLKYDYGIIHEDSDDPRGIDVCLIYRKDIATLLFYRYLKPANIPETEFKTRSVLYSKWLIWNDTIHIFLNHWPSRRGGVLAGESLRNSLSEMIKEKADSIANNSKGKARIIISGDFNCTPDDGEILNLLGQAGNSNSQNGQLLINLSEMPSGQGGGTYRYKGAWEMIDQVMVSDWFLKCDEGFFTEQELFHVFEPDFLLRRDPAYPGYAPFSTYRGYRYQGGFSDHLPVVLDLKKR